MARKLSALSYSAYLPQACTNTFTLSSMQEKCLIQHP